MGATDDRLAALGELMSAGRSPREALASMERVGGGAGNWARQLSGTAHAAGLGAALAQHSGTLSPAAAAGYTFHSHSAGGHSATRAPAGVLLTGVRPERVSFWATDNRPTGTRRVRPPGDVRLTDIRPSPTDLRAKDIRLTRVPLWAAATDIRLARMRLIRVDLRVGLKNHSNRAVKDYSTGALGIIQKIIQNHSKTTWIPGVSNISGESGNPRSIFESYSSPPEL